MTGDVAVAGHIIRVLTKSMSIGEYSAHSWLNFVDVPVVRGAVVADFGVG